MKIPDRDELRQLLAEIKPRSPFGLRDRAIVVLLANTGLRVSELASLNVDDVATINGPRDSLDLAAAWTKGHRGRIIPLNAGARKAIGCLIHFNQMRGFATEPGSPLLQNRRHCRLPVRAIQRMLQKYRDQSELSRKLTPHSLRHFCADNALRRSQPRAVQMLLGHKRLETLEVYTRARPEDVRAAVGD